MSADEIREAFLAFFEQRGHRRMASASLVPPSYDPSVLLTTAGMQPFKPYFRGEESAPHLRLTSCQKCFRTVDIENVGTTARHLTFFEMLGNFSFGDYFKQGAVDYAWELSTAVLGFDPQRIWVTVFAGDDTLGLGLDEAAVERWRAVGVPDDRIVALGRGDNFWQAGPAGPCGPCSELYLDRGLGFGGEDDRPGDDSDRFLEFWNLVFMQYDLHEDGSLTPLPTQNIDTGLGLDRLAAILQDAPSVFETEHFRPLITLGEELSGRSYGERADVTRALRIIADHGRAMTFLLADGVVPSNEDRGYVLRRIMRRAIQQARVLEIDQELLSVLCERVVDTMGAAYPDLRAERATIAKWAKAEEEGFKRTLAQGERLLDEIVARAQQHGTSSVAAADAFRLHDTYGFPYELTKELVGEHGLSVDDSGFDELMDRARETARAGGRRGRGAGHERVVEFARATAFTTRFVGYQALECETVIGALDHGSGPDNGPGSGRYLAKLPESPFYPEGGGQISDSGTIETSSGKARVVAVYRVGDDQAVALEPISGDLVEREAARAVVDRPARLATMANHTATHLLHAALRARLGTHVRQAGSYVGPDKLRFDFTHAERLSATEVADVEQQVNSWILDNLPVRAVQTTRAEAQARGAMALFGEKYGDWVRLVEVEQASRELCGGTHVASTAEIGLFRLIGESSSASNVRRIEAVTGRAGIDESLAQAGALRDIAALLKVPEGEALMTVRQLSETARELSRRPRESDRALADALLDRAVEIGGVKVVAAAVDAPDARSLLELSDQLRQRLGESAVVLGCAVEGRVHLVANFAPSVVERGLSASEVVRAAAQVTGGGGGGRDTMAQAGGRDPERLPEAIAIARAAIEQALG